MDQSSRVYRFCAQHKEPAVVLEQAARCKVTVGALASGACCDLCARIHVFVPTYTDFFLSVPGSL